MKPQVTPAEDAPALSAAVLLVDDHPANLVALGAILERLPIRLVEARSGPEALERVLERDFAVIVMDVRMPGMDGLETAAMIRLRPRSRHTPVIFVSAFHRDAALIARGYEQGAVDYLVKPYEPAILRSKVLVFVDLYFQQKQIQRQEALLFKQERETLERESEHRFRSLVDALPLSMWALRPDGRVYYENRQCRELAGDAPTASASIWQIEALHPDERAAVEAVWAQALASSQPFELSCQLRRAGDGAYRWHLVRAVPEKSSRGVVTGWVVAALDVDDQRRAEQALLLREQEARQAAEERSALKDQFLAIVSHELRTPLTGILGWTRVLRGGKRAQVDAGRALEAIERSARIQARLVDDLLDATRMATGKLRLDVRAVDLRALVSAVVDGMRPAAEAGGVALDVDLGEALPSFDGDPDRLQQVCWNLLSNSLKFTRRGGRIGVRLRERDGAVELTVSDDGQGIDPSFLPHVFEPFRQADTTSTRTHGGLGLGLALVRAFVEMHGGSVRVDSAGKGKGTTVIVSLPAPPARTAREPVRDDPSRRTTRYAPSRLDGVKVLVVEDDADTRALLTAILEARGAEVDASPSVAGALAAFHASRPDVILSDLAMPLVDGYALMRFIRSLDDDEGGATPAAAVTAHAEVEQRALEAGFQAQMEKPFDPSRLAALVARLARHRTAKPAS